VVDEDRPTGEAKAEPSDSGHSGPFGELPATGPHPDSSYEPIPAFESNTLSWPPPTGEPPHSALIPGGDGPGTTLQPGGRVGQPHRNRHRALSASVIAVAALTALVIGGAAGYGGATLARRASPAATSASPSPEPGVTLTPVPPPPPSANTVDVAKRVLPATVMIQVGRATGSGFLIDQEGRVVTNNHVVAGAADGSKIRVVYSDGRRGNAVLVGRSPSYDIAVIKASGAGSLQPIELGDSEHVQVGEPVIALGSPLGLSGTVTEGIVSARNRPVIVNETSDADAPSAYINAIQTDAQINPGSSGGPLVDAGGRVIGVNSAILTFGQSRNIGLGFAIPINQAATIADQLIKKGKATYPVIGANVADAPSGVELTAVDPKGPAATAGLRAKDLITKVDDQNVNTMEELIVSIRTRRPGDVVILDYARGTSRAQARVTLGGKEG
jgi:putative serine protease PepD